MGELIPQLMGELMGECFTQLMGELIPQCLGERFTQCLGECFTQLSGGFCSRRFPLTAVRCSESNPQMAQISLIRSGKRSGSASAAILLAERFCIFFASPHFPLDRLPGLC
jgi:hypothetical protein